MAICRLGALTYDLAACEVADSRPLSPASLADAVDILHALSSDIVFGWATTEAVRVEERYPARAEFQIGTLEGEAAPVVHLFARRLSSEDDWIDVAEDRLGGLVETAQWSSGVLDITATGVTKLATLRDYCLQRGIPQTSVVAIGDTIVDLPMMRWAEMGIAVGDAAQLIRDAANMVVARCEEHAVAEAIEAVLPGG